MQFLCFLEEESLRLHSSFRPPPASAVTPLFLLCSTLTVINFTLHVNGVTQGVIKFSNNKNC